MKIEHTAAITLLKQVTRRRNCAMETGLTQAFAIRKVVGDILLEATSGKGVQKNARNPVKRANQVEIEVDDHE